MKKGRKVNWSICKAHRERPGVDEDKLGDVAYKNLPPSPSPTDVALNSDLCKYLSPWS